VFFSFDGQLVIFFTLILYSDTLDTLILYSDNNLLSISYVIVRFIYFSIDLVLYFCYKQ